MSETFGLLLHGFGIALTPLNLLWGFIGVMLFGWKRVPPRWHFAATVMVFIGTFNSAFWILVANSWMHTPAGAELVDGVFVVRDWWAVIFNPSMPYRVGHMLLASYLTTALVLAGVVALMTVMQATGQLGGGWLGDRFSKRWIAAGCMLAHAMALVILALATAFSAVLVFAVLHGLAWGMRGPLMSAIRADYFGRGSIGIILGLSSMILVIGQIGGPIVAGAFADWTGNYRMGFTILAILAGLGSLFFLMAKPPVLRSPTLS